MSSITVTVPRFRVGDWVVFRFGVKRVIAQITEDRGPIGYRGRRLYGVQLDRGRPEPITTEVPEGDLDSPPQEFLTPVAAKHRGFSIDNWPRFEFDITYVREGKSDRWNAYAKRGLALEGLQSGGVIGYSTARYASEAPGDENFATITVLLEYDPRLSDPREHPAIWQSMIEEAWNLSDKGFKARFPESTIVHDRGPVR